MKHFFRSFIATAVLLNSCGAEEPKKPLPPKTKPRLPIPLPIPLPKEPEPSPVPSPNGKSCVKEGYSFDQNGPYRYKVRKIGSFNIYEPITNENCTRPVYNHCNGTGARTIFYTKQLTRMASHGFLAVSYESANTGSGRQSMEAIDWALKQPLSEKKLITAGHSQGGQCAASTHYLAEQTYSDVYVISVHEQPAYGMSNAAYAKQLPLLEGSTFVFHGSKDTVVPRTWVERGARLLRNDHYWLRADGATHLNPQSWAAASSVAFAKWKFYDMEDAEKYFMETMPESQYWSFVEVLARGRYGDRRGE